MQARTISLIFGVLFVAVGVLGFTPNALVGYEGIFAVNAMHNQVYILTGRIVKIVGEAYVAGNGTYQ